tara:strand:+ start:2894 stop:3007 length:114 start_codon:yes stop_codon:yes gene_type:complete
MAVEFIDSQNTGIEHGMGSRLNDDFPSHEQWHIIEGL